MKMYNVKEVYIGKLVDIFRIPTNGQLYSATPLHNSFSQIIGRLNIFREHLLINDTPSFNLFNDLICYYIAPKYYDYIAVISNEFFDYSLTDGRFTYLRLFYEFVRKFVAFYNGTIKKYVLLNSAFVNDLNSLLKAPITKIDSDTKGIDNDTPQSSLEGGLFNDIYASLTNHNIYHYENENDNQYYIDKITNLKAKWDDIMNEWASQFASDCLEGLDY